MPIAPEVIPEWPVPPPTSENPDDFDAAADATWEAAPGIVEATNREVQKVYDNSVEVFEAATEIAAAAQVAADAAGLLGRMSGSLALGAGTKVVTLIAAKPELATANRQVALILESDASIRQFGVIAASPTPTPTNFSVSVTSGGVFPSGGTGNFSGWKVIDAAFFNSGATAADELAETTEEAASTPKSRRDAAGWVVLVDGPTVTPNGLVGRNFTWTVVGSRLLAPIINCKVNQIYRLWLTKGAAGAIAWASCYTRAGGLPLLPSTPGQEAHLDIQILAVDGSGVCTDAFCAYASNPVNA